MLRCQNPIYDLLFLNLKFVFLQELCNNQKKGVKK